MITMLVGFLPIEPAAATGGVSLAFSVGGTLPVFPCPSCATTFSGTATGGGNATFTSGGDVYNATFSTANAFVSGSAVYGQPGFPLCPAFGSAAGTATLSGGATGVVRRSSSPTILGSVHSIVATLTFTYQRIGPLVSLLVTGGSVTVWYFHPALGAASFTRSVQGGAGAGVFQADPALALSRCLTPGPLPFSVVGDVSVALN